ncbi:MAG TPA: threonylcarbamoyl-AMP synthase [Gammaproteobacteria bacterium]|nr:threonylcarbamoyl-AMP synthase [Gammaproteobacteria bacterium]|tara:strand:- start:5918 stop:6529 length:612 start_codon:yes stop_codon:yes gene_type:complete
MSQRLDVHPTHPQPRILQAAAKVLKSGGLVVYPSDTTYAIACEVGNKSALDRLVALRRLKDGHQFSLACQNLSELGTYARVENTDFRLLKRNTPGAFTFILNASRETPKRLVNPKKRTVGLRVPDHPIAQGLLEAVGAPLITTTMRLPDAEACMQDPHEIFTQLRTQIDLVLDGGIGGTEESTVVDLTGEAPDIVRQGVGQLL